LLIKSIDYTKILGGTLDLVGAQLRAA
jgi:hypothetical protein